MEKIKIKFNEWPKYTNEEQKEVLNIVKSGKVNYWTGNKCTEFENRFKKKFKLRHTITVANGSVALDAAIKVLNLKKNDEILVTPRSYVSTASCIQSSPAKIKFVDIDLDNQNLSPSEIKKKISKNTKVIICTHLAGWPCDVLKIKKIIGKRKIFLIEDCSQAHGAKINNINVGSIGDISIWSFCNDKIISTLGEGGMIACKNKNIWKKLWAYKDCGKNYDKIFGTRKSKLFNWVHDYQGTNLRMTEIQAAVGIIQLKNLDKMIFKRNYNCKFVWKNIVDNKIIYCPDIPKNIMHSGYRCYIFAKNRNIRNEIIEYLNKKGIDANQGSCPEIYREIRFKNKQKYKILHNAKKLGNLSISLPSHNFIEKRRLQYMVDTINTYIKINDEL